MTNKFETPLINEVLLTWKMEIAVRELFNPIGSAVYRAMIEGSELLFSIQDDLAKLPLVADISDLKLLADFLGLSIILKTDTAINTVLDYEQGVFIYMRNGSVSYKVESDPDTGYKYGLFSKEYLESLYILASS